MSAFCQQKVEIGDLETLCLALFRSPSLPLSLLNVAASLSEKTNSTSDSPHLLLPETTAVGCLYCLCMELVVVGFILLFRQVDPRRSCNNLSKERDTLFTSNECGSCSPFVPFAIYLFLSVFF